MDFKSEIEKRDQEILDLDKRRDEISKRAAELGEGLDAISDQAEVEKRTSEAKALAEEAETIEEKRSELLREKAELVKQRDEALAKALNNQENNLERKNTMNEIEERAGQFMTEVRSRGAKVEARSILVTNIGTPIAAEGVVGQHLDYPKILDFCDVRYSAKIGAKKFTYDKTDGVAAAKVPGQAAQTLGAVVGTVTANSSHISAIDYVDEDIEEESDVDAKRYIENKIAQAVLRKVARDVITAAKTQTDDASANMFLTDTLSNGIVADTLRHLVLTVAGTDDVMGPGVLVLNQKNLQAFGAVRGTNEKKPIYEIEFPDVNDLNHGIIREGGTACPFVIDSNLTDNEMLFGKFKAVRVEFQKDLTIRMSGEEKFSEGLVAIKGDVYAITALVANKSMCVVSL